jgi:hypothetical protein
MNLNLKGKWMNLGLLSAVLVVIQVLLTKYVYPLLSLQTQSLFSISPTTALTSTSIGDKLIASLSGIVSLDIVSFTTWASMFIGAFLLVLAGYFVVSQKWAPWTGKNIYQRIWAILLYGTIVLYGVILLTKMSVVSTIALPLLIGLAINYVIVAGVTAFLSKYIPAIKL